MTARAGPAAVCPDQRPCVLIAAISGRALAQAARRDGYAPLVVDLFGDDDTQEAAEAHERLPGGLSRGIRRLALFRALARLAEDRAPEGLVYGSGFEGRPALLHRLGLHYTLLGNGAEAVRAVKSPALLAALCRRLDIPHPEVRFGCAPGEGWISKRIGGAGGSHIRPAGVERRAGRGRYVQQLIPGDSFSALFLTDGDRCRILGFSEQWTAPRPGRPFRYGGAAYPARLSPAMGSDLTHAVGLLARETRLKGLNSADFLAGPAGFHLLEVNPRPGATLDLFAGPGLFRAHLSACRGELVSGLTPPPGAVATEVAYARRRICLPAGFPWPGWASDRQPAGLPVPPHAPFCTVRAEAPNLAAARSLAAQRVEAILNLAEEVK